MYIATFYKEWIKLRFYWALLLASTKIEPLFVMLPLTLYVLPLVTLMVPELSELPRTV